MNQWLEANIVNILLLELIMILCMYRWSKPITNFLGSIPLYIVITIILLKWSFYCGSKSYII